MAGNTTVLDIKKSIIHNKVIFFDTTDLLAKTSIKYNLNRVFRVQELTAPILEYIQSYIERKLEDVEFNTVLPLNLSSTPYASDIAISSDKSLLLKEDGKFTTNLEGDEKILLVVDTIKDENDLKLIETIMKKINLFDAQLVGILIIFDQDIGEYIRILNKCDKIFSVFSVNDLCELAYNNNIVSLFEYEKYKFYSEKMVKNELIKLNSNIDNAKNADDSN
jgi:hypothetical protein